MSDHVKPSGTPQQMEEPNPGHLPSDTNNSPPFLFADGVTAFGALNGTVHVVLEALELGIGRGNTVMYQKKTVAHLRLTAKGATSLQEALEKALLAIMPVNGNTRN